MATSDISSLQPLPPETVHLFSSPESIAYGPLIGFKSETSSTNSASEGKEEKKKGQFSEE